MRRSKFTESHIVAALQEVEGGVPIAEVIRKHGISRGPIPRTLVQLTARNSSW